MKKSVVCILIIVCMISTMTVSAKSFSDVSVTNPAYEAISYLSDVGIINGYADGEYRPNSTITRAEAATIISRIIGMSQNISSAPVFADVPVTHWAHSAVSTAALAGIISGFGNGIFSPDSPVTYFQIIKMIVCMSGKENVATSCGGWPFGYVEAALQSNIINTSVAYELEYRDIGNSPAARSDVAIMVYNAIKSGNIKKALTVGGKQFTIGMNVSNLGTPDEILPSIDGFDWYVYGTANYQNFLAAAVKDGSVVALASAGTGFEYDGVKSGDSTADNRVYIENPSIFYTDSNNDGKVHAVFVKGNYKTISTINETTLAAESKMIFHFTNAFRVSHGKTPFIWSNEAAMSSTLHSRDMADNNYFAHESLDGRSPGERMQAQGIIWTRCAENIAAGRGLGILTYDMWVNSAGHRGNMLSDNTYLGVGNAYNANSPYGYYYTQNFFSTQY